MEIVVVSVRAKRERASRESTGNRATRALTAAVWSRCSVISSALPAGRIRELSRRAALRQPDRGEASPFIAAQCRAVRQSWSRARRARFGANGAVRTLIRGMARRRLRRSGHQ